MLILKSQPYNEHQALHLLASSSWHKALIFDEGVGSDDEIVSTAAQRLVCSPFLQTVHYFLLDHISPEILYNL